MTIYYGTSSLEESKNIRENIKSTFGKKVKVIFRPRGKRIHLENGLRRYYQSYLPMRYAERIAIYIEFKEIR